MQSEQPVFQIIERPEVPDMKSKPSLGKLCIVVTFAAFFISVFIDGIPGGYRLIYLFWPFYIIICHYLMRESKNKLYGMFFIVCVLLMFGFYYYNMQIKGNANEVVPYQSILKGIF